MSSTTKKLVAKLDKTRERQADRSSSPRSMTLSKLTTVKKVWTRGEDLYLAVLYTFVMTEVSTWRAHADGDTSSCARTPITLQPFMFLPSRQLSWPIGVKAQRHERNHQRHHVPPLKRRSRAHHPHQERARLSGSPLGSHAARHFPESPATARDP